MTKTMSIADTTLELVERGHGRPLLFLHPGEGLAAERPWLAGEAEIARTENPVQVSRWERNTGGVSSNDTPAYKNVPGFEPEGI